MASETKQRDYRDGWRAGQKWASTRQVLELDDLAEAMKNRTTWWHPVLVKGGQTTSIERMFAALIREISPNAATWVALVAVTIDEWTDEGGVDIEGFWRDAAGVSDHRNLPERWVKGFFAAAVHVHGHMMRP